VLQAVTTREHAQLTNGAGLPITETPVEPATSFTVARASREFANNSRIAFTLTNTSRGLSDELQFLTSNAITGGVDGDWRASAAASTASPGSSPRVA
jgi:hypothetical protein